jgi:hypothetical protein
MGTGDHGGWMGRRALAGGGGWAWEKTAGKGGDLTAGRGERRGFEELAGTLAHPIGCQYSSSETVAREEDFW